MTAKKTAGSTRRKNTDILDKLDVSMEEPQDRPKLPRKHTFCRRARISPIGETKREERLEDVAWSDHRVEFLVCMSNFSYRFHRLADERIDSCWLTEK